MPLLKEGIEDPYIIEHSLITERLLFLTTFFLLVLSSLSLTLFEFL
jgi:hypothetical protein